MSVLRTTVVAIFITATKSGSKVMPVLIRGYVITFIAIRCILISIRITITRLPPIFTVGLPCMKTFFIAVVYGLSKYVRPILIDFIVPAFTQIAITWRRVEIGVIIVVIVSLILKTYILLM